MRAVVRDEWGGPEAVRVVEVAEPELRPGHVLIAADAASVNALDWHELTGTPAIMRFPTQLRRPRDRFLGVDVTGVVTAVADDVTRLRVGDRVLGQTRRTFADTVLASEGALVPVAASVAVTDAAAVPLAGLTALQSLRRGGIRPGSRVLVLGAAGGVGSLTVQMARHLGAVSVAAATRSATIELVSSLGADEVLDSAELDPASLRGTADVIVDLSGTWRFADLRGALRPGGSAVLVGLRSSSGAIVEPIARMIGPIPRERGGVAIRSFLTERRTDDLATLSRLLEEGTLRPVIDSTVPLTDAAAALGRLGAGEARGKIVLQVR